MKAESSNSEKTELEKEAEVEPSVQGPTPPEVAELEDYEEEQNEEVTDVVSIRIIYLEHFEVEEVPDAVAIRRCMAICEEEIAQQVSNSVIKDTTKEVLDESINPNELILDPTSNQ